MEAVALRPYRLSNTDTRKDRLAAKRWIAVSGLKRVGVGRWAWAKTVRRAHCYWREFGSDNCCRLCVCSRGRRSRVRCGCRSVLAFRLFGVVARGTRSGQHAVKAAEGLVLFEFVYITTCTLQVTVDITRQPPNETTGGIARRRWEGCGTQCTPSQACILVIL